MDSFKWDENFVTGIEEVDAQHMELVKIINRLGELLSSSEMLDGPAVNEVLDELGIRNDPLLEVAMELERIALSDSYFIEKKLYPNIDFYSGITLKAMGFPTSMFTVLFALARTVGWIAQWGEMIEDPAQKIGRPRQIYTGAPRRDYVPLNKR